MPEPGDAKTAVLALVLWVLLLIPNQAGARVSPRLSGPAHKTLAGAVLSQRWEDLSPRERKQALRNFQRFQQLSPEQQKTLEQQYHHWRSLPPEEQQRIRRNYEHYQQLDPYEKEEFEELYRKWKSRTKK